MRVLDMGDGTFLEVRQCWCRYCHQWVDVDDDDTPIEPTPEGNLRAWHPDCAVRIAGDEFDRDRRQGHVDSDPPIVRNPLHIDGSIADE